MIDAALKLSECTEYVQHQPTGGAAGVDLFGQRTQPHVAVTQMLHHVEQMR
jgi:hypothetical protein